MTSEAIVAFTLLYGGLAVIEVRLMLASIRKGPEPKRSADSSVGAIANPGAGYAPLPAE